MRQRFERFADRLAALEALEAEAKATPAYFDEHDADALDDAELLYEMWDGLLFTDDPPADPPLSFCAPHMLGLAHYFHPRGGPEERYWTRVAERSSALLKAHGMVLLPLLLEDIRAALALLDAGGIPFRALANGLRSHSYVIQTPYGSDHYALCYRLARALDQWQRQTGGDFIQTADALREVLESAIASAPAEDDAP